MGRSTAEESGPDPLPRPPVSTEAANVMKFEAGGRPAILQIAMFVKEPPTNTLKELT